MTTFEPYRVITDYEALQDGFLDRIEDLNTTLAQIDMAAELGGNITKFLGKGPSVRTWDRNHRDRRTLGWESLGKMLKGTGLALVLVIDDERFAQIKEQLAKRKNRRQPANAGSKRPTWLINKDNAREMGTKRMSCMTPAQLKRHQRKAGKASAKARRVKARLAGTLPALQAQSCSAHGQPTSNA